jgi:hypothetical protein
LGWRVLSDAVCEARSPLAPTAASSASMAARRFENTRRARFGIPAISAEPFTTGSKPTPEALVQLVTQDRLVEVAGSSAVLEQRRAVQGGEPAVGAWAMLAITRWCGPGGQRPGR